MIEYSIIPIITYGCESWNPNKTETKSVNSLLDNIIKRILMTPQSTPREALYIETGLLDPETIGLKQKVMMDYRLTNNPNPRLHKMATAEEPNLWKKLAEHAKGLLEITDRDTQGKKPSVKNNVKAKTAKYFKKKITQDGQEKSKIKFLLEGRTEWKPHFKQKYLAELTRLNACTIFHARTRMIDIKNNFRNKYPDITCRACGKDEETQEHVLETCQTLHKNPSNLVTKIDIFEETTSALQVTAQKIRNTLEKLKDCTARADAMSPHVIRGST